ncbi:MAG: hypothetical protein QOD90_533 [Mycobacterium sp.]|jgi:hypothetical protein|nr:hypothetical protein [Mycobacterium sp.]
MGGTYEEFAAEHAGQHLSAANRWCAVVGNYSLVPIAVSLLLRRPRVGAAIFLVSTAFLFAGHIVEGTFIEAVRDFARHPIWGTRADIALANATIKNVLNS